MPYHALDFFAGAGGLSEGLREAGVNVIYANEIDQWAKETYKRNHPETVINCGDIRKLTRESISMELKGKPHTLEEIDIIVGGPPCQGFSIIGQRYIDDPRNRLFQEFLRIVKEVRPKSFIMENVFGLLSIDNGSIRDNIIRLFTEAGYIVTPPKILTAADYGVPQMRRRVFFIGIRGDLSAEPLHYPETTHVPKMEHGGSLLPSYVTVNEAISDLPSEVIESKGTNVVETVEYGCSPKSEFQRSMRAGSKSVYNHHTKRFMELRQKRVDCLGEGDTKACLPEHLQAGGHDNKYRRLASSKPAPTLTAHMSKDLSDFIHPRHNRSITVREAARLQSFPDTYVFVGSEFQQLKQIGNAVPPRLGAAVVKAVVDQLKTIEEQKAAITMELAINQKDMKINDDA